MTEEEMPHPILSACVIAVGTLLLMVGMFATSLVAAMVSVAGRSGVVSQSFGSVSTPAEDVALLADGVHAHLIPAGLPAPVHLALGLFGSTPEELVDRYGEFVLIVTPHSAVDSFVGIDGSGAANDYLFGRPYTVGEFIDGQWHVRSVPGEGQPEPPAGHVGWAVSATGNPASLDATHLDGQTLVVMNADASPGVDAALQLEYHAPQAEPAIRGAGAIALVCALGGLVLILLGMGWLFSASSSPVSVGDGEDTPVGRHA